ncbi:uncharacterized protein LOC144376957 [Ictidomys tridecemlineatus]
MAPATRRLARTRSPGRRSGGPEPAGRRPGAAGRAAVDAAGTGRSRFPARLARPAPKAAHVTSARSSPPGVPPGIRLTGAAEAVGKGSAPRLPGPRSREFRGGGERGRDAPSRAARARPRTPLPARTARAPRATAPSAAPTPITWRCPRPAASCAQAGKALTDTISAAPKMADVSSRP